MKDIIRANNYNYLDLVEQYKASPIDLKPAALHELGEWFRSYSEGRCWNGECWDCPEAGIRIRPVYIYNAETDEYDDTDDYEEV